MGIRALIMRFNGCSKDKPSEMKTEDEAFQRFYILPDEKMRVRLKDVEQEMLGMRSCWRCEYSLIQPDLLMHIPAIQSHAGVQALSNASSRSNLEYRME